MAGLLDLLLQPKFDRIAEETSSRRRKKQTLLDEAALGQVEGGQQGPFRKDLVTPETGLSKGLDDQNPQQRAATQAGLLNTPNVAGPLGARIAEFALGQQGQGGGQLGTPSFKDFTVESMDQFQQTGDPNALVRFTDPQAV
ncbi:unnamed protein product, partial [marine sediment metagenome]